MTARFKSVESLHCDEVVDPPVVAERACHDHNFELPNGIYAAMALLFAGAIAVLAVAFHGNMGVSDAAIFAFLLAFFAIPVIFVKSSRQAGAEAQSWRRFRQRGIMTGTGHAEPGEATVLVLMLPFFVLCFAIAISTIAAIVH